MQYQRLVLLLFAAIMGFAFGGSLVWGVLYSPPQQHSAHTQQANSGLNQKEHKTDFWEKAADDPVAYFTFWLVAFTGVLAISTAGLWVATIWLYRAGERQIEILRESGAAQSRDMQASIAAAQAANALSRDIFIADQRPWLQWTMPAVAVLKKNGPRLVIDINGTLKNLGRTPASNISYFGRLYVPPPNVAAVDLGQLYFSQHMAEMQSAGFFSWASVLPAETVPMRFGPEGVVIAELPESFTLWLTFHTQYMFATGTAPNPRTIAEIGGIYMIQPVRGGGLNFQKATVIESETPVAIVEFHGGRLLT